jgi:hypothetical protein
VYTKHCFPSTFATPGPVSDVDKPAGMVIDTWSIIYVPELGVPSALYPVTVAKEDAVYVIIIIGPETVCVPIMAPVHPEFW